MKLLTLTDVLTKGEFPRSEAFQRVMRDVREAVDAVRWPPGGPNFTIYPESGKKRGKGNGVKPIKVGFVAKLKELGWEPEARFPRSDEEEASRVIRPGAFDAWLDLGGAGFLPFVVEWETGNVSSSHRSLNRIALALELERISGGLLIVPTADLAQYLTDRIGNYRELSSYFPLFSALAVENGYLGIAAVEHDATSHDVPRIAKGTDGRALV
jgi:hypothetical protein